MSTCWYGLKPPVTSIRVQDRPGGSAFEVIIWLGNQQSGRVIVLRDELESFIDLFLNKNRAIIFQQAGGHGRIETSWVGPDDYHGQVISDYYDANIVHRDDYIMERAGHLWKSDGPIPSDDKSVGG